MPDEMDEADNDQPTYRSPDKIQSFELGEALNSLALLGGDPYLTMQTTNLTVVDQALMDLEQRVLHRLIDEERTPVDDALFLSALSQMWIFAAYELLRTWRQRAKSVLKWSDAGGLEQVIKNLRINPGYLHPSREIRADQLQRILDNPDTLAEISADLQRSHIVFRRLEYLRISLAKHEIAGKKNSVAYAPGYARIHRDTGSLEFELANDRYIIGYVTRRDIADEIRILAAKVPPQSDDELASFDSFMKGADDRPEAGAADGEDI